MDKIKEEIIQQFNHLVGMLDAKRRPTRYTANEGKVIAAGAIEQLQKLKSNKENTIKQEIIDNCIAELNAAIKSVPPVNDNPAPIQPVIDTQHALERFILRVQGINF